MNAFDDEGKETEFVDFDYDEVDRLLGASEASETDKQAAFEQFVRLQAWVWQHGPMNMKGFIYRAAIACWVSLPWLSALSLTDLAIRFNVQKQSLGRWVDDFKKRFPHIRNKHMKK